MQNTPLLALILALGLSTVAHAEDIPVTGPQPTIAPLAGAKTEPAAPLTASTPGELNDADKANIARVEQYFNGIKTLKADFMQTLSDGSSSNGTLFIKRPGKMRLQYAPPNKDLLVSDGLFVHAFDSKANTSSSVPLGRSLADVILRDPLKLSGDVAVKQIRTYPGMMEVDITQANDPASGSLTLELQDNPLQLRSWRVKDASGAQTRVALSNEQFNQNIPGSNFAYRDPNFGR